MMQIKKKKSLKNQLRKGLDRKKLKKPRFHRVSDRRNGNQTIIQNAYASLVLPRLNTNFKCKVNKHDIFININSNELIDDYYILPNKIDLNGSYEAGIYLLEIENTIPCTEYELKLNTINLDNDFKLLNEIKAEINEINLNKKNYFVDPKGKATQNDLIKSNILRKVERINSIIKNVESSYLFNLIHQEISKMTLIKNYFSKIEFTKNTMKSIIQNSFNLSETDIKKLIEMLKINFNYSKANDKDYTFSSKNHNFILGFEQNFEIPHIKISFEKGKDITGNKLHLTSYIPDISLIQPIFCDVIRNNVSNNNIISYINIKNKLLTEDIREIENQTYFSVTQTNINRIKIWFNPSFSEWLKHLKIKFLLTLHLKPL